MRFEPIDTLAIDTLRTLSMDAVEAARSGHPGTPMAMAPVVYTLWQRHLRYDPADPGWPDRDRFVLSIGHASALLYALLHIAGVREPGGGLAVPLDELRRFRQLGSRCPGHPERGLTAGVEVTTGPLGQGLGTSVGLAIAGRSLAARYGAELFSYDVYALAGDGDLMEGISSEAASLAGHLRLENLCWIYDQNHITIEGPTELAFTEDVPARFEAQGFRVRQVEDANDLEALDAAFAWFRAERGRPALIVVRSHIAYGAPEKQDTAAAHGAPLGPEQVRLAKRAYGWPEESAFLVPPEVPAHLQAGLGARGRVLRADWEAVLAGFKRRDPARAAELDLFLQGGLPDGWDRALPVFPADPKGLPGRAASSKVLQALESRIPWLVGGAADLAPSTLTRLEGSGDFRAADRTGRNFHFGVREHAMGAVLNGLALSGLRPFGATFLVFSDYLRPALRLSALMELSVILVFTHDSIAVGEDGPTHQPIEHLAALRAMPGLVTLRPADAEEVREAYRAILSRRGPAALILSRQAVPTLDRTGLAPAALLRRGAYVLAEAEGGPARIVLLASGSEVSLCLKAREQLQAEGLPVRVVSVPSFELFAEQDPEYRAAVLPPALKRRLAVELGTPQGWDRLVGSSGRVLGLETFGASAPADDLLVHLGFTAERVAEAARALA